MDSSDDRLIGWKEIAEHLGVSVKTAQVRERDDSLPVRRAGSGERPRVWAYRTEIDAWLETHRSGRRSFGARSKPIILGVGLVLAAGACALWLMQSGTVFNVCKPRSYEVTGNRVEVFDSMGRLCWQHVFGSPPVASIYQPGATDGLRHAPVVFADLQQDGNVETLFNFASATSNGSSLVCFNEDGSIRWEKEYGRAMTAHGRPFGAAYSHDFTLPVLDGRYVVTIGRNQPWFPSYLALRDPEDGSLIDEYWHPGEISDVALFDLDGDGKDEILMAGINNPGPGPGHPALFLLDLPFSDPATEKSDDNYFGSSNCKEEWYVLLPRPDVADALRDVSTAHSLSIEDGSVHVAVGRPSQTYGYYTLSLERRQVTFQPSDLLLAKHRELELSGALDHQVMANEFDALSNVLWLETAPVGNSLKIKEKFRALQRR